MLAVLTSFDGGRLFGQVYGSGAPRALALHGWRRDHKDFALVLGGDPTRGAPAGQASVLGRSQDDAILPGEPLASLAVDLPGFGATPEPEAPWGSLEYARAVAPVLSAAKGPVVVIGHSFGGRVAVRLAAEYPEAVAGLVLSGAPLFPAASGRARKPPLQLRLGRLLARGGLVGEDRLEELRQRYGSPDYRAASPRMRGVLVRALAEEREAAYSAALRAIACPVELVWGELDTAAPPAVADQIAAELAGPVRARVLPGVGHLTPLLVPGELRAAAERLLT